MTSAPATNPLLEIRFRIPFEQIRAEHVEPAIAQLLDEARAAQKRLSESTGERTYANTMLALEDMTEKLDFAMGVIKHLESVATYPEFRAAYNAVQEPVSKYYSGIVLDPGLWRVLKEFAETAEAKALTGARKRFLTKTIDAFRRHGAELDPAGKKRLEELDVELTLATTKFAENVLDATNAFELVIEDESKLAGLPETAREAARAAAAKKGVAGWRFTLQQPSLTPLLTYLEDRDIRRDVWLANGTRASGGKFDNTGLIGKIIELRRQKAELLGYANFADLVLVERMAKTGAEAKSFVDRLRETTVRRFEEENRELQEFRNREEGSDAPRIEPWDVSFYAEKLRRKLYDFDEEALRPYFPVDRVIAGMYDMVLRLYGIRVIEEPGAPVWDSAVRFYSIYDEDGSRLGSFYADWFPRENKRPGAWMDAFLTGTLRPEGWEPHLGLICGNLTPPVGDKPALLTHREVETIFHEFGHLLHHLLSRVEVRSLAGTNVAWDFVELPSQIMENWCWERECLDLFARHYETGEAIPEDLFDKMRRARTFRSANAQMRQLGFGTVDLSFHTGYQPERDGNPVEYAARLLQPFTPAPLPPEYAMVASFSHLFSNPVGYGAGYYSYKWAEVLDADAFTKFRDAGIFNRECGQRFRDCILSKGDSTDPAELFRSFMGRDPDPSALLVRSGLA